MNGILSRVASVSAAALLSTLFLSAEVTADVKLGTPTNLGPTVNSPAKEGSPSISADGLELYFNSTRPGGSGGADIWVSRRATTDDDWKQPVNLGPIVNSPANEGAVTISADGLALYFHDWGNPRPGGFGETDLWVTTRATKGDAWGVPVNLGPAINTAGHEATPNISADGLELYFESDRAGGFGSNDILVATRATIEDEWGMPTNLGPRINSSEWEHCPNISADGLTLYFDSKIPGNLMVTTRATVEDDWGEPVDLGHTHSDHYASSVSADGSTLYFASKHPGGSGDNDIWQLPISISR